MEHCFIFFQPCYGELRGEVNAIVRCLPDTLPSLRHTTGLLSQAETRCQKRREKIDPASCHETKTERMVKNRFTYCFCKQHMVLQSNSDQWNG